MFPAVLRVAHGAHCAAGATATAARFSFFLVADHLDDDQRAYKDKRKRDENGCKILRNKVEYGHSVHLFILYFFRQLGRFLVGLCEHEDHDRNEDERNGKTDEVEIAREGGTDLINAKGNDIIEIPWIFVTKVKILLKYLI